MSWWSGLTAKYLFFTGKGGVGKTSLAAATALALAEQGRKVLIVSTDPASNLDEVFGCPLTAEARLVPTGQGAENQGLWACNLDPMAAAAAYRERVVAPYRGVLPPAVLRNLEEQFSGACTTELAAFNEFVAFLAEDRGFEHVVFDTAPTGHTLRLLRLPGAWSGYLNTTTAESSCLGPLAGLQDQRERYELALQKLRDQSQTQVVLVARPEGSSLREADRTAAELSELGIECSTLLINGVLLAHSGDPLGQALSRQQQQTMGSRSRSEVPLLAINTVGMAALRQLLQTPSTCDTEPESDGLHTPHNLNPVDQLIQELLAQGRQGVVLTMGKGGVGKTSVAIEIAQGLASHGCRVRLTTTDPAGDLLERVSSQPNITVDRIDPQEEVARYTQEVLDKASSTLDAEGLSLLQEDLRSPCSEEIAVFRAFADAVADGQSEYVIIDTAPTGHTILLMDASEAYNREVGRNQGKAPDSVAQLLPRLRDPRYTKVVLVTLAEPTPVHEAAHLQSDLRRAGIEPFAWVVNRCWLGTAVKEPLLLHRAHREASLLQEIESLSARVFFEPFHLDRELCKSGG